MTETLKEAFDRELHQALQKLYNPAQLRKSLLLEILNIVDSHDPLSALRRILRSAIQSLKPGDEVPLHADAWRVYQVLEYRYLEQLSQKEVAADLNLSIRQLRRQEKKSVAVLADYLIAHHSIDLEEIALHDMPTLTKSDVKLDETLPGQQNELEWLRESLPNELADIASVIEAAVETIAPLAQTNQCELTCDELVGLPQVIGQTSVLRQTLLSLLTAAVQMAPSGLVQITAESSVDTVLVHIRAAASGEIPATREPMSNEISENLRMARQLTDLFNGKIDVRMPRNQDQSFSAELLLPAVEQVAVLVIDDNAYALELLERYLEGTRYRFIGAGDPEQALVLANEITPQIIVMDVMLPGIDGWELLGRFRTHPKTQSVPVIACTILPQEQLALTLGAAGFLRKPVSREALIAALDQQMDSFSQGSH